MPALYTITTRASGTILTAAIYNSDHQNHVNNGDAQHLGGFSSNTAQMRTQTSPGDVGSESLSLSISDELARIRYMIAQLRGTTFWYGTLSAYSAGPGGYNYVRNSDMLTLSRQGQGPKSFAASAGDPYTADQWYVRNGVNQGMTLGPTAALVGTKSFQAMYVQRNPGQTGVGQMWIGQPFSLPQFVSLIGQQICFSFYCSCGANFSAPNVIASLIYGTGANAAKLSGFTAPANLATTTVSAPISTTTRISATGVIPANATQLELNVNWFPVGTAGANDLIIVGGFKLEPGSTPTTYYPPDPYAELAELQTWYWKSFLLGIAPAQNAGSPGSILMPQAVGAGAGTNGHILRFPTRMLKTPVLTFYNPGAANAQARNNGLAADCSGTAAGLLDETGFTISCITAAGSAAGQANSVHATADAGI